ncbi:hypothetical protein [Portibacter lacus]|uniref:Uncharacterized protein n=1 Tax=Portibacter lacus TaxID=1099794 RepID=A0AA37SL41_9BACT|nr:hypothetical protein [Portibacter lacus]GLR15544.1 hypothetical protein GCM10007940_01590 [Portibacter lacus]
MKLRALLTFAILTLILVNVSIAQIDTTRNHEIRYGLVGSTLFSPDFDSRLSAYPRFNDMSLSYLRRFKSTPYFMKAELSGKVGGAFPYLSNDSIVSNGTFYNNALFLGVERQTNFKHFGFFMAAGVRGSFVNLKADFNLPGEVPVLDFQYNRRAIGVAGQLTFLTNITDNLYVFLTSTFYMDYATIKANKTFGNNPDFDYDGLDFRFILFDGLGLSYKF